MEFQKIEKNGQGIIHLDTTYGALAAGVIYLNQDIERNTGTSFYKLIDPDYKIKQQLDHEDQVYALYGYYYYKQNNLNQCNNLNVLKESKITSLFDNIEFTRVEAVFRYELSKLHPVNLMVI